MAQEQAEACLPAPRPREIEDHELLSRVAQGDVEAFERLYRRYYKPVFGFAARITRRMDVAEEVVDDTMMTVWRKAGDFAGRSKPSTWIFGIAYRKALKATKPAADGQTIDAEEVADHRQTDGLEAIVLREHLARALGGLPPSLRAVVELTYLHGYKYSEIAEIVDCPVGTVKTRMRTARGRLRALLTGQAVDDREARHA